MYDGVRCETVKANPLPLCNRDQMPHKVQQLYVSEMQPALLLADVLPVACARRLLGIVRPRVTRAGHPVELGQVCDREERNARAFAEI